MATPSDPGQTAVRFLEKVRTKNLNLEPGGDTALAPQTSEKKREQIASRLDRMARDLGSDPLEIGAVKLDGELAAVIVRKIGGFDPSSMQVFPVALVKRGAEWTAAPVPASFENSGVRYATRLRERLKALEDWMMREQVLDLAKIREQSAARMRRKIEENLTADELQGLDAGQTTDRFLKACGTRNLPEILGLLGGLSTHLPRDWSLRIKVAESAIAAGSKVKRPWRLFVAHDVLRAPVLVTEDQDSAMVSIACLDPAAVKSRSSLPKIQLVHLELSKGRDGLWRVDPPAAFLSADVGYEDETDDQFDADLLDAFARKLADAHPPAPEESLEKIRASLTTALGSDSPAALVPLIQPAPNARAARKSLIRAARLWWTLRNPATLGCAVPLADHSTGDKAAGSFQFFSIRNPDHFDLRVLYFSKTPGGWLWTPEPPPETTELFQDWTDEQADQWQLGWQSALLKDSAIVTIADDAEAPSEEDAQRLIASWLKAVATDDVPTALRLTARLDAAQSNTTLLRNLGYEMTAPAPSDPPAQTATIHRGGPWTTAAMETKLDANTSFPVYPILTTSSGPRILLEIDLLVSTSRSRGFLNQESLKRLRKINPAAAASLKTLFALYPGKSSSAPPR